MNEVPLKAQAERFLSALPHCRILNMRVEHAERSGMTLVLPYSPQIVGNPQNGAIHGGAITTLMDTTCGMAILCGLEAFEVCPTLDLRIDYLHSSVANLDVYGHAECFRVTRDVIFIRGSAYQDDPARPIAQAVGTYMRLGKDIKGGFNFSQRLKGAAQ
ncbi:thioesterase [Pseudomonas sp. SDI]|uniref:PaaI family thioesterase n=1 Tax=Pseudomonas sp. SDI TaxID=2170734 RepID=UPI000DE645C5|nr:PaaI family thioesterase [Pseudomonas sp. SDI]PWB35715.1 thioesterase [Pseudomonas sp. SDI]